MHQGLMRQAP